MRSLSLTILACIVLVSVKAQSTQPSKDTTARVPLPVLRRFVETTYSLGLNDAQRIRLNLALREFQSKLQLSIDSADKKKKL